MASRVLRPFTDNRPGVTFCDLHFGHSFILVTRGLDATQARRADDVRVETKATNRRCLESAC